MLEETHLLERSLMMLRDVLRSDVECGFVMVENGLGDVVPEPGTGDPATLNLINPELCLVRDLERKIGRPVDHPEPQWLDDLIDGKWSI